MFKALSKRRALRSDLNEGGSLRSVIVCERAAQKESLASLRHLPLQVLNLNLTGGSCGALASEDNQPALYREEAL